MFGAMPKIKSFVHGTNWEEIIALQPTFLGGKNTFPNVCIGKKKKTLFIRMASSVSFCVQGVWVLRRVQYKELVL